MIIIRRRRIIIIVKRTIIRRRQITTTDHNHNHENTANNRKQQPNNIDTLKHNKHKERNIRIMQRKQKESILRHIKTLRKTRGITRLIRKT